MPLFPVQVKLERSLPPQQLEEILVAAANDIGWKAKAKDKYEESYKYSEAEGEQRGWVTMSLNKEREYHWTNIDLRGSFLPAARITLTKKDQPINYFTIGYGGPWGVALKYEIEKYLGAVSERIKAIEPKASLKVLAGKV